MAYKPPWDQGQQTALAVAAGTADADHGAAHDRLSEQEQAWQAPLQQQQWALPRRQAAVRRPSLTNQLLERLGLRRNSSSSRRFSTDSNTTDHGRMDDVAEADAAAAADKQTAGYSSPSSEQGGELPELPEDGLCASLSQASLASRCRAYNSSCGGGNSASSGWSMCNSSVAGSGYDSQRQRRDSACTRRSSNSSSCAGRGDGPARCGSRNSATGGGSDWASVTGYGAPRSARVVVPEEQLQAAADAAPQAHPATSYVPYASTLNVNTLAIKVEHSPDISFEEAAAAADAAVMRALARCPHLALQRIAVVEGCVLVLLDLAAIACPQGLQKGGQELSLIHEDQPLSSWMWQQQLAVPVVAQGQHLPPQAQQQKQQQQQVECPSPDIPREQQQLPAGHAHQQPVGWDAAAAAAQQQRVAPGAAEQEDQASTEAVAAPASSPAEGGATATHVAGGASTTTAGGEQVPQVPALPLRSILPANRGGAWTLALPAAGDQLVCPSTAAASRPASSTSSNSNSSSASSQDAYLAAAVHSSLNTLGSSSSSSSSSAAATQQPKRRGTPTTAGLPVVIQACGCGVATCGHQDLLLDLVVDGSSSGNDGSSDSSGGSSSGNDGSSDSSGGSSSGNMRVVLSGPRGAVYDREARLTFERQQGRPDGPPASGGCWAALLHLPAAALGPCPGTKLADAGGAGGAGRGAAAPGAVAGAAPHGGHTCPGHSVGVQLLPSAAWVGPGGQEPWLVPGRATVLLLPSGAALELQAWVAAQQVSVASLQGLVHDLSALLDARQLLCASCKVGRSQAAAAAAAVVPRLLGVARLGAVAGERLEAFLEQAGLVELAQLVAVAKVQLLLCMALLPREVGLDQPRTPTRQRQQQQVAQPSPASCAPHSSRQAGRAAAAAAAVAARPKACLRGVRHCAVSALSALTRRLVALRRPTAGPADRGSGPAPSGPLPACAPINASSVRPTCGEHAAVVAGSWGALALCWRGFGGPGVEEAYCVFKARHLRLVEWVGRLYLLVFVPSMMVRHMLASGWWPLHTVYGWHWLLDHSSQAAIMAARPGWWLRHREAWLLAYDARLPLYLAWELVQWSPQQLHLVHAGTSKLVLFGVATSLLGLQRPKAALARCAVLGPLLLWQAAARARPGTGGVEAAAYAAVQQGGWRAVALGILFLFLNLLLQMAVSFISDLYSRRLFVSRGGSALEAAELCSTKGACVQSGGSSSSSSWRGVQAQLPGASLRLRHGVAGPIGVAA